MDEVMLAAALEYLKENVSQHLTGLSEKGAVYLLDKHYPTGSDGFQADIIAGFKS